MAASSSSSQVKKFHVFPSFHGPDVRRGFLSHLHDLFARKKITIFKDQEIERGHTIGSELLKAIREARLSIVLLSKNYASSSWCLEELVEILKCREDEGQIVMPIFYEVDPSHVRNQNGDFGIAFEKTCETQTKEVKKRWSKALTDVANIEGEHSRNWTDEAAMVQKLSTDVSNKLRMEEINKEFRECDVDQNGFITTRELRYKMTKDGEKVTHKKVRYFIRKADVDGDGQLNYDEFVKVMMATMTDEDAATEKRSTDIANKLKMKEIKEQFRKYDVDKNGFITAAELRYVCTKDGKELTDEQFRVIIRAVDLDGDGQINYDEFVKISEDMMANKDAAIKKFSTDIANQLRVEEMKEDFKKYDVDKNGFITAPEFQYVMTIHGEKVTDEHVEEIIRKADVDGDGRLNYDEFRMVKEADEEAAVVRKFATDFKLSREEEKEMKETFTVLDVDKNGFITEAEFQYKMKIGGLNLTDKEVRKFFRRADVDGDDQLNYDELVKVMMAK